MKKGLLMWIFKDSDIFYIRFLKLFGLGFEKLDNDIGFGYRITIGIWKLEFGFHLIKRKNGYVKRNQNEKSPQAFA